MQNIESLRTSNFACMYVHMCKCVCPGLGTMCRLICWKIPVPMRKRERNRDALNDLNGRSISECDYRNAMERHRARIRPRHPAVLRWGNRANRGEPWIFISFEDSPVVWPHKSTPALIWIGSAGSRYYTRCYYRLPSNQCYNVELMYCLECNGIINKGYA